jgi:hypothetical protein
MWTREQRAIWEMREFQGVHVQHVIGWVGRRHCGCVYVEGVRLDKDELTFGATPCEMHGAENARAMEVVKHMPPQAVPMHELWEQRLDFEITPYE